MNLLIVKLSAVGDVVMSLPFLEAMRRAWPDARISWVVEEAAADVLTGHPALDRVIVSRRKSWFKDLKAGHPVRAWRGMAGFLRELRRERFDIVVDLQGLFKSGILTFFSRGRRKVGFDRTRELSWIFLSDRLPSYDPERHALLRYLDVAEYLGADVSDPEALYNLPVHGPSAEEAERLLPPGDRPRIVLNPGTKWVTKLWPAGHWRELGLLLERELGAHVILTGSPDEAGENRSIAADLAGATDLTGRTGLRTLGEVYRQADLLVCPDTGPMHLAAVVGTRVVALFGPTSPGRTGPFGSRCRVLTAGLDCAPCLKKQCPDPRCMTDLKPDAVLTAVKDSLQQTHG